MNQNKVLQNSRRLYEDCFDKHERMKHREEEIRSKMFKPNLSRPHSPIRAKSTNLRSQPTVPTSEPQKTPNATVKQLKSAIEQKRGNIGGTSKKGTKTGVFSAHRSNTGPTGAELMHDLGNHVRVNTVTVTNHEVWKLKCMNKWLLSHGTRGF